MAPQTAMPQVPFLLQGLKPLTSGSVDTYVKANLLPGASKVRGKTILGLGTPLCLRGLAVTPHDTRLPGQPAEDPHSAWLWGCHLGRDAHLPRLHLPGRRTQDPAVRLTLGLAGGLKGAEGCQPGLTCTPAQTLCV